MMDTTELKALVEAAAKLDNHKEVPNSPSRSIVWSRDVTSSLFDTVLSDICNEIEGSEGRKRKRPARAQGNFTRMVKALVLDLYVAWKSNKRMQLGLPLNKNDFSPSSYHHKIVSFYQSVSLSYIDVLSAYKGLETFGYLTTEKKGYFDKEKRKGKRTRIRATRELITRLEQQAHLTLWAIRRTEDNVDIVLKDSDKVIVTYKPKKRTKQMSDNLALINQHLSNTWIDLYIKDAQFSALSERMHQRHLEDEEKPAAIDISARTLRRIFNNDCWNEGGRFYGGWWQSVPSEYRKFIHIEGKKTVELDYSGIHPAMLYAEVGVTPPPDPYDMGLNTVDRKIKKVAFNALVNASNMKIKQDSDFDANKAGCTWGEFLYAIIDAHQPIRRYFGSGEGLRLQRKDSDIAEKVMLKFVGKEYACLPVHDSFLVHHELADELAGHMEDYYEEIVGVAAKVEGKSIITYEASVGPYFEDMSNLDEIYSVGEYSEYTNRKRQWYSFKGERASPSP